MSAPFYDRLDTDLLKRMREGLQRELTQPECSHLPRRYARLEARIAAIDDALRDRGLSYLLHLVPDGPDAFTCLLCHRTSHNQGDVEHHYCGSCHVFHDDVARGTA